MRGLFQINIAIPQVHFVAWMVHFHKPSKQGPWSNLSCAEWKTQFVIENSIKQVWNLNHKIDDHYNNVGLFYVYNLGFYYPFLLHLLKFSRNCYSLLVAIVDRGQFQPCIKKKKETWVAYFLAICYCYFVRLEKECLDVLLHKQANVKPKLYFLSFMLC